MNTNILKAVKKTQAQGSEIQEKKFATPQILESRNQTSEQRNRKKNKPDDYPSSIIGSDRDHEDSRDRTNDIETKLFITIGEKEEEEEETPRKKSVEKKQRTLRKVLSGHGNRGIEFHTRIIILLSPPYPRERQRKESARYVALVSSVAETRKTRSTYKMRNKMSSIFGDLHRISLHQTLFIIQIRKPDPTN
ncbi:unnamed protein product [Sphenostylis stenocarpa]|uniref:Uncharacterized protein n=1 Tax=Sphenostylis stenocarpa TaxID=92480 RepID=A0AA86RU80_9FABA|nr:unnamed protein product [Sphenostylis stenocarpa]